LRQLLIFPEIWGEKGKNAMARGGMLRGKEDNLVKDLEETTLSFKKLSKRYGVTSQAIQVFFKKRRIKRPQRTKGHQIGECSFCQKLIQIGKRPNSEFISSHTIRKEARVGTRGKYLYHLKILRDRGLVNQKFGRLHSEKAEKAYSIYFTERLPIRTIGWKVGYKNFQSIIRRHLALGWDVPPSLYVYDRRERSKVRSQIRRRQQR
jgi:hypothetical protein